MKIALLSRVSTSKQDNENQLIQLRECATKQGREIVAECVDTVTGDDWGVGWRSFQEPYFDSCGVFKDVVISIAATLAESERNTISERTKAGLARTRKAGTRLGRRPAQVDMALVEKRHASGESLRGIARSLRVSPALLIKRRKAAAASRIGVT
jgi:DNA invertase Pin-like site-specific DNA recombinase